jgi:hypothetical protein
MMRIVRSLRRSVGTFSLLMMTVVAAAWSQEPQSVAPVASAPLRVTRVTLTGIPAIVDADRVAREDDRRFGQAARSLAHNLAVSHPNQLTWTKSDPVLVGGLKPLLTLAKEFVQAEMTVNQALDSAWSQVKSRHDAPTLIDGPVRLALLQVQVELRRLVGPSLHTRASDLANERGCAGDLIRGELIDAYAQAVTRRLLLGEDAAVPAALAPIARQIACLSVSQLSALDLALSVASDRVVAKLKAVGLEVLTPALLLHLAPIELLVLDVRKVRGSRSASWQWFRQNAPVLKTAVAQTGWPGGVIWLWDRVTGRLVGYPPCTPGLAVGDCADPSVLIESLVDPRALGRGDCALAAMISLGAQTVAGMSIEVATGGRISPRTGGPLSTSPLGGGFERYVCPSLACSDSGTTAPSGTPQPTSRPVVPTPGSPSDLGAGNRPTPAALGLPWPDLSDTDIATMAQFCVSPSGSHRLQGNELGDCALQPPQDPFDRYLQCMVEGNGSEPAEVNPFAGVPIGSSCKLKEDTGDTSGGSPPAPSPAPAPAPSPSPAPEPPKPADKKEEAEHGLLYIIFTAIVSFFGGEAGAVGAEAVSPHAADGEKGAATEMAETALRDAAFVDGTISQEDFFKWHGKPPGDIADFLKSKTKKICVDPLECGDSCTGLGEAVATDRACSKSLMNDLLTAAGMPPHGVDLTRKRKWVSIWDPERAPVTDTTAGMCLPSDQPPHPSVACGLMLCADEPAASAAGGCCGGHVTALVPTFRNCLETIHCEGGVPAVSAAGICSCAPAEETDRGTRPTGPSGPALRNPP